MTLMDKKIAGVIVILVVLQTIVGLGHQQLVLMDTTVQNNVQTIAMMFFTDIAIALANVHREVVQQEHQQQIHNQLVPYTLFHRISIQRPVAIICVVIQVMVRDVTVIYVHPLHVDLSILQQIYPMDRFLTLILLVV